MTCFTCKCSRIRAIGQRDLDMQLDRRRMSCDVTLPTVHELEEILEIE